MAIVSVSLEAILSTALIAILATISLFSLRLLIKPKSQSRCEICKKCPTMVIAKGVISKAFQKGLIGQKHLRWSIGIGWDEDFNKKVHYHKDSTTDEYGAEIVQNCVHWLFRFDKAVQRGTTQTVQAWECFPPEGPFVLTEKLYGSQCARKNHLRVHDPENHIQSIGQVHVDLLKEQVDPTQFRRTFNSTAGKDYLIMDYEMRVTFDPSGLGFDILIPPNGEFEES